MMMSYCWNISFEMKANFDYVVTKPVHVPLDIKANVYKQIFTKLWTYGCASGNLE